jgi:hypothetical protein
VSVRALIAEAEEVKNGAAGKIMPQENIVGADSPLAAVSEDESWTKFARPFGHIAMKTRSPATSLHGVRATPEGPQAADRLEPRRQGKVCPRGCRHRLAAKSVMIEIATTRQAHLL